MGSYRRIMALVIGIGALWSATPAPAGGEPKGAAGSIAAGVGNVQNNAETIELVTFGQTSMVETALHGETEIEGICVHCRILVKCTIGVLGKHCAVCPCDLSNGECLTGKGAAAHSAAAFIRSLPPGTRLQVEFAHPGSPADGIKRLVVDRHGALLPVEGLTGLSQEQVAHLGDAVGATRAERSEDGGRLQLTLKDDWTAAVEARLEKALAKVGAKVAFPGRTVASR